MLDILACITVKKHQFAYGPALDLLFGIQYT